MLSFFTDTGKTSFGRASVFVDLPIPQPLKGMTQEQRKLTWLHFTMVVDKVLLYTTGCINILAPIVIFGIVPLFQQ